MTIDHLTYHAERIGDQIAVIDDRPGFPIRKVNYHDFNAMVNRLTNGLLNLGLQSGSHIAWWGNNSLEILTAIHAIRKSGGMSIPIPYKLRWVTVLTLGGLTLVTRQAYSTKPTVCYILPSRESKKVCL